MHTLTPKVNIFLFLLIAFTTNCGNPDVGAGPQVRGEVGEAGALSPDPSPWERGIRPAAYEISAYLPSLQNQRIALLVNQTSTLGDVHLVDTLVSLGLDVQKIFAPEHGFRGSADAGAKIKDGRDVTTGLPIKSLYGKSKKPSVADLADVDVIVFDVQDVGARFYTYISSLFYVLEAAGEQGKKVVVLDRPNPNGHYVDGPMLEWGSASFVGIAPIPVVHGLTVGEFARMAIGEGWLKNGVQPELEVVTMPDYTHATPYELPVPPSPNLPNQRSIYLYPSLCFFEGTAVSVGRGTNTQFQVYGHPALTYGDDRFTPRPGPGSSNPKLNGENCVGVSYAGTDAQLLRRNGRLDLQPLLSAYRSLTDADETFFTRPDFFDLLAGGPSLREAVLRGDTEEEIRAGWAADLADYGVLRERYLLYR